MRKSVTTMVVALLAVSALWAGEPQQQPSPTAASLRKRPALPAKPAEPAAPEAPLPKRPEPLLPRRAYTALTIGELVGQDPNRWSDNMSTYAEVGGFVTQEIG